MLMYAAMSGNIEAVKYLVEEKRANINAADKVERLIESITHNLQLIILRMAGLCSCMLLKQGIL